MGLSIGHMALLLVIVLVVFGAGRLPQVMGDLGKGLRAFKDGLKESESSDTLPYINHNSPHEPETPTAPDISSKI